MTLSGVLVLMQVMKREDDHVDHQSDSHGSEIQTPLIRNSLEMILRERLEDLWVERRGYEITPKLSPTSSIPG